MSNSIPEIQAMKTAKNVGFPNTANTQAFGNFEDYVLKAYESQKKSSNTNALYKDLSGFGSSAALATLLRNNPNNPALMTSYLNAGDMNPSNFDEQAMKITYSNYLQNIFAANEPRCCLFAIPIHKRKQMKLIAEMLPVQCFCDFTLQTERS